MLLGGAGVHRVLRSEMTDSDYMTETGTESETIDTDTASDDEDK